MFEQDVVASFMGKERYYAIGGQRITTPYLTWLILPAYE